MTLPNIKWGLLYGVILCNARAMGEFGAVSVVAGTSRQHQHHAAARASAVRRRLDSELAAAFAVASLLAMLALVTLVLKSLLQWKTAERPVAGRTRLHGGLSA